jgi:hypothetical protein
MTVPQAAIDAAKEALRNEGTSGQLEALAAIVLEAAAPHIAAAERGRIYAELGNDHYVIFTEDRWTVEHSVECRISGHMPECDYHAAVRLIADEYDPDRAGRWRITGIDSEGLPSLERTNPEGGHADGT